MLLFSKIGYLLKNNKLTGKDRSQIANNYFYRLTALELQIISGISWVFGKWFFFSQLSLLPNLPVLSATKKEVWASIEGIDLWEEKSYPQFVALYILHIYVYIWTVFVLVRWQNLTILVAQSNETHSLSLTREPVVLLKPWQWWRVTTWWGRLIDLSSCKVCGPTVTYPALRSREWHANPAWETLKPLSASCRESMVSRYVTKNLISVKL